MTKTTVITPLSTHLLDAPLLDVSLLDASLLDAHPLDILPLNALLLITQLPWLRTLLIPKTPK